MADWRKVALAAILADGKVDEAEVKVLKKELYADGVIDREEVEFLIELRGAALKKAKAKKEALLPVFDKFFAKAIQDHLLADGKIDADEVTFLREKLFADSKIDQFRTELVTTLNKKAKEKAPEFEQFFEEATTKFKQI